VLVVFGLAAVYGRRVSSPWPAARSGAKLRAAAGRGRGGGRPAASCSRASITIAGATGLAVVGSPACCCSFPCCHSRSHHPHDQRRAPLGEPRVPHAAAVRAREILPWVCGAPCWPPKRASRSRNFQQKASCRSSSSSRRWSASSSSEPPCRWRSSWDSRRQRALHRGRPHRHFLALGVASRRSCSAPSPRAVTGWRAC